MTEPIEFDPVDQIVAGALGEPGHRTFLIQAWKQGSPLTVLVEKEQVAALSGRILDLVATLEEQGIVESGREQPAELIEAEPLFRARLLRIGFDPGRDLILLELFEQAPDDTVEERWEEAEFGELVGSGRRARLFLEPAQARAMASAGAEAVSAGRPTCRMCWLPIDPEGHLCPALN